ncbi:MAG TPA: tRNA pseudouridine(55) synthase TruB [Trueperaceae bacterium]
MPVYIVDKPLHLSSHDVVAKARQQLATRRVGHAGTLDPLATGVLVILAEEATKLSPFLTATRKQYLAWVSFGAGTPTLDAEGPVVIRADASQLTADDVAAALPPFLALHEQVPPQYSAIKMGGVKGYEAARRGEELALPPRPVGYERVTLLDFAGARQQLPQRFGLTPEGDWRPKERGIAFELPAPLGELPTALVSLSVHAGTYVRAFARDLGERLGLPAHLSGLVRTRSGESGLERAVSHDELAVTTGLSMAAVLPYPLVQLSTEDTDRVRRGQRLPIDGTGRVGLVGPDGELIAVAEVQEGRMKLLRVWAA